VPAPSCSASTPRCSPPRSERLVEPTSQRARYSSSTRCMFVIMFS
jgi:hypothetical protein